MSTRAHAPPGLSSTTTARRAAPALVGVAVVVGIGLIGLKIDATILVVVLLVAVAGVALLNQRREQAIRGSERRLDAILQHARDIVVVLDPDHRATFVSSAVTGLLGTDADACIGRPLSELVHPADVTRLQELVGAAGPRTVSSMKDVRLAIGDGRHQWFDVDAVDLTDLPEVGGVVLTCHDANERRALQDQLSYQSAYDALTGLPNRSLFADHLERLAARDDAEPFAVLYIDLDHFKPVNDTYGFSVGDDVLRKIGHRLQTSIRSGGDERDPDMVCRLGGDEFAVLLPGLDEEHARLAAERMLAIVRQPIALEGATITVSATIGVAQCHPGREHPDVALRNADSAMYRAKQAGRDSYELCVS
jgi:diguanylate cyclase (GGDEF)-like protein/PAS domain S-box-containing protein